MRTITKDFAFRSLLVLGIAFLLLGSIRASYAICILGLALIAIVTPLVVIRNRNDPFIALIVAFGIMVYCFATKLLVVGQTTPWVSDYQSEVEIVRYALQHNTLPSISIALRWHHLYRPEYVLYPLGFLLQTILCRMVGADPLVLMYHYPVVNIICVASLVALVVMIMRRVRAEFSCLILTLLLLNFVVVMYWFSFYRYRIVAELLSLITIYLVLKLCCNELSLNKQFLVLITLLLLSLTLYHSSVSYSLTIYLSVLALFVAISPTIHRGVDAHMRNIFYILCSIGVLMLMLVIGWNVYVVSRYAIKWFLDALQIVWSALNRCEVAFTSKEHIVLSTLTRIEWIVMFVSFALFTLYILVYAIHRILFGRFLTRLTAFAALIMTLLNIALFVGATSPWLAFRAFWISILSIVMLFVVDSLETRARIFLALPIITIVVSSLFATSMLLYSRIHLLASEVYVHEAFVDRSLYVQTEPWVSIAHMRINKYIADAPSAPFYELRNSLYNKLYVPLARVCVVNDSLVYYTLRYLNGIYKSRPLVSATPCSKLLKNTTLIIAGFDNDAYKLFSRVCSLISSSSRTAFVYLCIPSSRSWSGLG